MGNSASGHGSNGNGGFQGNVNLHPTFTTPHGTSITPQMGRAGDLTSLNPQTGVNYGGGTISQQFNGGNTNAFVSGQFDSNGGAGGVVGINHKF
jgi:hypothetical protein